MGGDLGRRRGGAAEAYDLLADVYDTLTDGYCHDRWLGEIERIARIHGLRGHRLLDVACGTGKSFLPLMVRGYDVTACDISARMVEIARDKAPEAELEVADMRALRTMGAFDLITCLDDAVNYLLDEDDLAGFLDGVARNLAPDGVAAFDVNSLGLYRSDFARDWLIDEPGAFIVWTAQDTANMVSGDRAVATVHVFAPEDSRRIRRERRHEQLSRWIRRESRHEQRHWSGEAIAAAAASASLRIAAVYGQSRGAILEPEFDELRHTKALYVAIPDRKAVSSMHIIGPR